MARWAWAPGRRAWAPPLVVGLLVAVLILPLDPWLSKGLQSIRFGGDLRREINAFQQYGQGVSCALIALVIWLQDPPRRRRLADWGVALALAGIAVTLLKGFVGRPRPKFDDPFFFLGPFGAYPIKPDGGVRYAWEVWGGISSDLWSMPSSHTVYAVVMAVFIGAVYPRLRVLAGAVAGLVGLARVLTGAHYPSDVVVGASLGLAIGRAAVRGEWGVRLLERLEGRKAAPPTADSAPAAAPPSPPGPELAPAASLAEPAKPG